jgi:16S rRNA (cytosine967-C5)-methyltransferase
MAIAHSQRLRFLGLLSRLGPAGEGTGFPARVETLLREERSAGSRDRRLYRELLYTHRRFLPWLRDADEETLVARVASLCADTVATRPFRECFARPESVVGLDRRLLLPSWLEAECPAAFTEPLLGLLNQRAPLWLRLQGGGRDAELFSEFEAQGWTCEPAAFPPGALRLPGERDVTRTQAFEQGLCEVQDIGSQLILTAVRPEAGTRWFDACAGAGGKSLQLANLLGPHGRVDAHDVRPAALQELRVRAGRAGFIEGNPARRGAVVRVLPAPDGLYDGVLVDAPCSGSGTWRRSPHLKWCTTPESVRRSAALQSSLLSRHAAQVRPGGRLVYATCSLCRSENEAVVEAFLSAHPGFTPVSLSLPGLLESRPGCLPILPGPYDGDAFFAACLKRGG